jgi:hypothetical protein
MATGTHLFNGNDAATLARLIHPERDDLPAEVAKAMLAIRFDSGELDRIHELLTKNQDDALTSAEKADLESYLRVSSFLFFFFQGPSFPQETRLRQLPAWMPT